MGKAHQSELNWLNSSWLFSSFSTLEKANFKAKCVTKTQLLWLSTMAPACARLALLVMTPQGLSSHPLLDAQDTN